MQIYKDLNRDSGVLAYDIEENSIIVQFKDGAVYSYTYTSAGVHNIESMKKLAEMGNGLNSYINRHVKKLYARKGF